MHVFYILQEVVFISGTIPMKVTKSRHSQYRCSIGVVKFNWDILEFTFGTKVAVKCNEIDYSRSNAMATETLGP